MKIGLEWRGTKLTPADYALLKAALVAAQSATPTGRAARDGSTADPQDAIDPRDALEQMFAGLLPARDSAAALDHCFAPAAFPEVTPDADDMFNKS